LDRDVSLHVLTDGSDGTALLLEYSGFRILIPGGVGLKTLQEQASDSLLNLSVLVLDSTDIKTTPAQSWESLAVPLVLWNETDSPPPVSRWIGADTSGWIHVTTNGNQMQISIQHNIDH
jgi:hypothetical protein